MKYDFDEIVDRRGTLSYKWDGEGDAPDIIQMWVADMDFRTAPEIIEALQARVEHGIFGYVSVGADYYEAIVQWFSRRHGWSVDPSGIIYTTGVVPAVSAVIKAMVRPGDGVILQTPAYNCFFSSIRNNKAVLAENPLKRIETSDGYTYTIDFDNLEQLASRPENTLMILCNPHNPTGRIWSREELERIADITSRHGVTVLSDEIHCELVHPHSPQYIPYATVDPGSIVCTSPSKAFNIAGLQVANIHCPDPAVKARIDRAINDNEVCDIGPLGATALIAAYDRGEAWLDALNAYLYDNYRLLRSRLTESIPSLRVCDSEATYLAWVDVSLLGLSGDDAAALILEKARVRVSSGSIYGDNTSIRLNYACPRPVLEAALTRITAALKEF